MKNQEIEIVNAILRGEHWQDNLAGLNWTDKLKQMVNEKHQRELQMMRMEHDLTEMKAGRMQLRPQHLCEGSIVTALKSTTQPKIREIGFNTPDDMIMANFGSWFASLIQPPSGVNVVGYTMADISNTSRATIVSAGVGYSPSGYTFNGSNSAGTQIQFGSGTTAPTRTNYAMQTPLGNAPENARFPSGSAVYANLYVTFGNVIVAGGSGTINEIGMFGYWLWSGLNTFLLARDVLGAGVSYVAGNPLVGTFTWGI